MLRTTSPTPRPPRLSRAALIMGVYTLLGVTAVVWSWLRGDGDVYRMPSSTPSRMALSPLLGLLLGLVVVFLSRWATRRFDWARVLHREFHAIVYELTSREIVLLALFSSVGEELFFRGALVPHIGVVASSVIFALLHFRRDRRFVPWTIMSFVMGLVLGVMYVEVGDLGGPIVAHFTINLLNLAYIARTVLRA